MAVMATFDLEAMRKMSLDLLTRYHKQDFPFILGY